MSSAAQEFEAVYRKYGGLVRATLRRYGVRPADLDDVAQEAFVTIHRKLPEFEGRSSLETWLHAVSWRTAVGYRRRAHFQRESAVTREAHEEPVIQELAPDQLHELLATLPEEQRELLALSEVGGLSISALAEIVHLTREAATGRLKQARLALQRGTDAPPVAATDAGDANAAAPSYEAEGVMETADSFDYVDDDGCICVIGPKTFVMWRRGPDARLLGMLKEAMRKSMEREGPKLTFLAVIEASSAVVPLERAARKVNTEIIGMVGRSVLGAAFVIETNGRFNGVPAVINTAAFLTRSATPFRYFTNVKSATTWLAPRCQDETPASLTAQAEWMRGRLDARKR